jgi:hypothetical protein
MLLTFGFCHYPARPGNLPFEKLRVTGCHGEPACPVGRPVEPLIPVFAGITEKYENYTARICLKAIVRGIVIVIARNIVTKQSKVKDCRAPFGRSQ